jgi:hypothetical protein
MTYQFLGKERLLISERHEECESGTTEEICLSADGIKRRWELTPPLRRSDLIPHPGIVGVGTFVIASTNDSESSDGMIYLGSDRYTESQEQRVNDTYHQLSTLSPRKGRTVSNSHSTSCNIPRSQLQSTSQDDISR